MEGYASVKQICGFYQISKSLAYDVLKKMQEDGSGVIRIGRAVRVKISDFDNFIRKETEEKRNELQETNNP